MLAGTVVAGGLGVNVLREAADNILLERSTAASVVAPDMTLSFLPMPPEGGSRRWPRPRVGVTIVNLSVLKNDRAKAVRFSTLSAICRELDCQPGDLLAYDGG